ncbi:MAG: tRNA cyclic N6-threonylcarbamoyladenosine(37) synthase TcdA [Gammaproteobacteria bacterium]|nr:tRNA cyclic N6-threonylcarbamoyladenosine(37) synthase TcdA [Gammaproteobacteria bacterium]
MSLGGQAEQTDRRFGGIARLYGLRALKGFGHSHVCVIGIGGVGSWATEALARSAIGRVTLIDLDQVAESNINRQLHALTTTLGRAKVGVMAQRIRDINPHCEVIEIEDFLTLENMTSLVERRYDFIIDCIDNFRIKAALIAYCRRNRIRIITIGGAGGQTDPTRIRIADLSRTEHDPLLARTRKQLRQQYRFPSNLKRRFDIPCVYSLEQLILPSEDGGVGYGKAHDPAVGRLNCAGGLGSVTTVTAAFGLAAVSHVLRKLAAQSSAAAEQ